jgi:hypothetical protein
MNAAGLLDKPHQHLDFYVPVEQQKELVKILGKRLREIPELDAEQVLPAEFELHLDILRRLESFEGETSCPERFGSDAGEQSN